MKHLLILICLFTTIKSIYAVDTMVKGFVALDLLSLQKKDKDNQSAEMGIGTIDLKFYFNHEDFGAKIKLDLDGDLATSQSLYEEATVTWRPSRELKFKIGKGKVAFHQMHFGVIQSNYIDGGSVLGTRHSFRDQDRKIITSVTYGGYRKGFRNTLTFYGDAQQPETTRKSELGYKLNDYDEIEYASNKSFNTKNDKGIANKLEIYPIRGLNLSFAGLYRDREIDFNDNWAADFAVKYRNNEMELWFEYVYAYVSNHPNDKYTAEHQYEQMFQLGMEYRITEVVSLATNWEAAFINKQEYNINNLPAKFGTNTYGRGGQKIQYNSYKAEIGTLFRLAPRLSFKVGVMYERRYDWFGETYSGFQGAYELGSGVSYWF